MTSLPLHDDCIHDTQSNAVFYPGGFVIELAADDFDRFLAEDGQLLNESADYFDPTKGEQSLRDSLLHEVCHYMQFVSTPLGWLHTVLRLALAEVFIAEGNFFKTGAGRLPSQTLSFVRPKTRPLNIDICKGASRAATNLWKGGMDTRPIVEQICDLKGLVNAVLSNDSLEGIALGNILNVLDSSKQPQEYDGGHLAFPLDRRNVALFSFEECDLSIVNHDGQELILITITDLIESHARLMEEYTTLLAQAHDWRGHPWATDREYRASKQLEEYGKTRHVIGQSIYRHGVVRNLLKVTKHGSQIDFSNRDTLADYLHLLEIQLLVHDVALMLPLFANSKESLPWECFSPLERFAVGVSALRDWNLESGVLRSPNAWFQIADLITNRIGGPSYTQTAAEFVKTLKKGELSRRMPHFQFGAAQRMNTHPYLGVFFALQDGIMRNPGPFLISKSMTAATAWTKNPKSDFQWQLWLWDVSASFNQGRVREKLGRLAERCSNEHAQRAATKVGLFASAPKKPYSHSSAGPIAVDGFLERLAEKLPDIITLEALSELPRWPKVAFAARCAREIEQIFSNARPPAAKEEMEALWGAISVAEQSAASGLPGDVTFASKAFDIYDRAIREIHPIYFSMFGRDASVSILLGDGDPYASGEVIGLTFQGSFQLARALVPRVCELACRCITPRDPAHVAHSAYVTSITAAFLLNAYLDHFGGQPDCVLERLRRDFEILQSTAKTEGWHDNSPVRPSPFSAKT